MRLAPRGNVAYVSNSLDDSLSVIDLQKLDTVARIDLGGSREITKRRRGELLFHSANITFRKQYACASCHPDGHIDGVTYDIEADGIGVSPVDNRTLRGILDTAPFKWEGTNPSLSRQCGARLSVFFTRLLPFTPEELSAVELYVTTIERPPNRYRALGAPLTSAQRRGKTVFERTMTNDGRMIPLDTRCVTCHFPPYFTDRLTHDVGTRQANDRKGKFDTPHLNNIYDSAPYLHNGMAATLEEIWTVYNPDNQDSGIPSDFNNNLKARSSDEAWFCSDKGVGVITDFATNTWVAYTRDPKGKGGKAVVSRDKEVIETVEMPVGVPHSFIISADIDGDDVWIGTAKGLGWGKGEGYYRGLRERPRLIAKEVTSKGGPDPKLEPWIVLQDHATEKILKGINSLTPYQAPNLPLKIDANYANTGEDVEPYGGVAPYKRHFLTQMEYTGAGRSIPEPGPDLKSVKIGFIGPIMSTVSVATGGKSHEEALGIRMLQGARLAIEEANARGGYLRRKIPFELVTSNDNGLWGASGNEIIKMAYKDDVWGILGTIDGANSHIAIRVALKAEVVMMNSGDTDPTFIETNIPWTMRCIGDDRQMGYLLIDYIVRKMDHKRIGIILSSNRYGRFGVREVRDSTRRLKRPVIIEMAYKVGSTDFSLQLERLMASKLDAVIHWGDAAEGAIILNEMRKMGMNQPFYGCDRTVSEEFTKAAGANAERVIAGFPWNPDRQDPKYTAFRERFVKRFGREPETYAAHGYDGMNGNPVRRLEPREDTRCSRISDGGLPRCDRGYSSQRQPR